MKLGTPEERLHLSKLARAEAIFYMNGTFARNQAPITKNIEQNGYSLLIRLRQGERTLLHVTHRIFLECKERLQSKHP